MSYQKGVEERRKRIEKLRKMLENNKEESLKTILAKFCIETGVSMRTAREYYALLVNSGAVEPHPIK